MRSGSRPLFGFSKPQALGRLLGTCEADAISASGRLASAPTKEHLVEHLKVIYAANLHAHY